MRWGFDAEHRDAFGLGGIGANTWRPGLTGCSSGWRWPTTGTALRGTARSTTWTAATSSSPAAWRSSWSVCAGRSTPWPAAHDRRVGEGARGIADSLSASAPTDTWQRAQLSALLEEVVGEARTTGAPATCLLSCDDVRSMLADRLRGQPTRANFRTGHLTVCTLVPMRSIPHQVVCLLGLDDGSFPRHIERDGDDLTARRPTRRRSGRPQRGPPAAARRLAGGARAPHHHLHRTGRALEPPAPPAVPVGELLDVIDRTVRTGRGAAGRRQVTHPLQPFDARNYERGGAGPAGRGASTRSISKAPARPPFPAARGPPFLAAAAARCGPRPSASNSWTGS